jgi:hypothetical protein
VDIIADESSDAVIWSYPVATADGRPVPGMLRDIGWSLYPGSEWDEEPPGVWTVAVYEHQPGRKSGEKGGEP